MSEIGNLTQPDFMQPGPPSTAPAPTPAAAPAPAPPKAAKGVVHNQAKFEDAIQKIQQHVKQKYGYTMSYNQASGLASGDPEASSKISINMPTIAFKDSEMKRALDESGTTGIYKAPGSKGPGVMTLDAKRLRNETDRLEIERNRNRIDAAGTFGVGRQTYSWSDFGITPEQKDGYLGEDGEITDSGKFSNAIRVITGKLKDLPFTLTESEIRAVALGQEVSPLVTSVTGRAAAVDEGGLVLSEEELAWDKVKTGMTFTQQITMADIQQDDAKELANGWYVQDPDTGHSVFHMGTGTLAQHQIDLEAALRRDGLNEDIAARLAANEIAMLGMTGFSSVKVKIDPETGERTTYDENGDGIPDEQWIHGSNSIAVMEIVSRESIAALDNENRITLESMGITGRAELQAAVLEWERQQLEGYDKTDGFGNKIHVYGAQEWSILGPAQAAEGFEAQVVVGYGKAGEPLYQSVDFLGTDATTLLRDAQGQLDRVAIEDLITDRMEGLQASDEEHALAVKELTFELEEKMRTGYFIIMRDDAGKPILQKPQGMHQAEWDHLQPADRLARGAVYEIWVPGTDQTAKDIAETAHNNNVSIERVRAEIAAATARKLQSYKMIQLQDTWDENEKQRVWEASEAVLDRASDNDLQDDRLDYNERIQRDANRQASWNVLLSATGTVGANLTIRLLDKILPSSGKPAISPDAYFAAHLSGKTATAAWWKEKGLDDADAEALAQHWEDNPLVGGGEPVAQLFDRTTGELTAAGITRYNVARDAGASIADAETYAKGDDAAGTVIEGTWTPATTEPPVDGTPPIGETLQPGDPGYVDPAVPSATTYAVGDTFTLEGGTEVRVIEAVDGEMLAHDEAVGDADPNFFKQNEDGTWTQVQLDSATGEYTVEPQGAALTVESAGPPVVESGNFSSFVEDVKGLSGRDILSMMASFTAGYGTAGVVASDANIWVKGASLGMGSVGAAAGGPLTIGAYAAGFMAQGIWHSFNYKDPGTKRRYEWAAPVSHRPPGFQEDRPPGTVMMTIDWHADPTKEFAQDGSNLYDPNTLKPSEDSIRPGVVYWVDTESGESMQESLADYQERTGRMALSWYGGENEMFAGLSPEMKAKFADKDFKPTFIFKNADDSMTFVSRDGKKSVLLEPDEVERMFPADSAPPANSNTIGNTADGDETDQRGVTASDTLLDNAVSGSRLGAVSGRDAVVEMADRISDSRRKSKFLSRLAGGEPFSEEDVDDIFFADENAPGNYRYLSAYQDFQIYVEQDLLFMQSEDIGA